MQDFSVPSTKVGTAVTEAMADLKMTSIEPGRDGVVYKIQAKTEDNRDRDGHPASPPDPDTGQLPGRLVRRRASRESAAGADGRPARNSSRPPPFPSMFQARRAPTRSSRGTPFPTKRCSRTSPKHPIATASFLEHRTAPQSRRSECRSDPNEDRPHVAAISAAGHSASVTRSNQRMSKHV